MDVSQKCQNIEIYFSKSELSKPIQSPPNFKIRILKDYQDGK